MSDLERPWVERRRSGPPSSCPVCGAMVMKVHTAGIITCTEHATDHFEWRPDEPPVVSVSSERADEWKCSWCRGHNPATETRCRFCDIEPVASNPSLDSGLNPDADNRRYDKPLTSPHSQPEVESCPHSPRCRDRREASDPEWTATEMACGRSDDDVETQGCDECIIDEDPRPWCDCRPGETCGDRSPCRQRAHSPDDCPQFAYVASIIASAPQPPLEGEILGVDWRTVTAARLGGQAARLAAIHQPVRGGSSWPINCSGCDQGCSCASAAWPCETATLVLEMMKLTPSDIAITEE